MSAASDIRKIAEQEETLIFERFDEAVAFELGSTLRERALSDALPICIDIRTFDRPLFYAALAGSNASNPDWARRKFNALTRWLKSTYRLALEKKHVDGIVDPREGLAGEDYVLAGGAFPIRVRNAGVVGAIIVSGLPQREDHAVVVDALCDHLGVDRKKMALPKAKSV
ncbi:MAG: heme-degrading domain-containing protein [Rhizobiaceae bacterium]|nr:heme-degrading domain-containing protein [Rhizobiaceae bacterium]